MHPKSHWLFSVCLVIAAIIYWQGLDGIFLLDDLPNLAPLAAIKASPTSEQVAMYLGSVTAKGGSRLLALLSFVAQYQAWPADPVAFRLVNLIIHLINAVLIYVLIGKLFRISKTVSPSPASWLAAISSGIWLLHPLQVSTVLYVIQRMTELMVMFTLAGLVLYLTGRERLLTGNRQYGFLLMTVGIVAGGLLAVLCKENGVLLPVYVLVIELTLLANVARSRSWWRWSSVFLIAPLLVLCGYLLFHYDAYLIHGYADRGFTLYERWLTQFRVLMDYLGMILWPGLASMKFFHDDYLLSSGLLNPWTTLPAMLGVLGMLAFAIFFRKRFSIVSFAVLWFFAGQSIESSVFPLEIMFEHRNYLPMLGIIVGLVCLAYRMFVNLKNASLQRIVLLLLIVAAINLVAITYQRAVIWGHPLYQAAYWARQSPASLRAQDHYATLSIIAGDQKTAFAIYNREMHQHPDNPFYLVKWLTLDCHGVSLHLPDVQNVSGRLATGKFYISTLNSMKSMLVLYKTGKCAQLNAGYIHTLLDGLLKNPAYQHQTASIYLLKAELAHYQSERQQMLAYADKAMNISGNPSIALQVVAWLVQMHEYRLALQYLEKAEDRSQGSITNLFYQYSLPKWRTIILNTQQQ